MLGYTQHPERERERSKLIIRRKNFGRGCEGDFFRERGLHVREQEKKHKAAAVI